MGKIMKFCRQKMVYFPPNMAGKAQHTFVILAYKESKHLEECIQSVLNQTIPGEVLIATSTPNAYIDGLAKKYNIEVKANNNGGTIGKDWNFGYRCASTPCVIIAHQDDVYLPRYAEKCMAAINANKGSKPLMVFNNPITYKGEKEVGFAYKNLVRWFLIFPFHFKKCIKARSIKKSILLLANTISCPGVFYVKDNLSGFSFNETDKFILDWRAWYDMSQMDGAFIYEPEALHIHREHEESATSTTQLEVLQYEETDLLTTIWGNRFMPRLLTKLLGMAK